LGAAAHPPTFSLPLQVTLGFPDFVRRTNIEILRDHLEASSYTSGSHDSAPVRDDGGQHSAGA
jgi:hypothetical protein